jgi:hypothetical protein
MVGDAEEPGVARGNNVHFSSPQGHCYGVGDVLVELVPDPIPSADD